MRQAINESTLDGQTGPVTCRVSGHQQAFAILCIVGYTPVKKPFSEDDGWNVGLTPDCRLHLIGHGVTCLSEERSRNLHLKSTRVCV